MEIPKHFNHIPHSAALIWIIDPSRAYEDMWRYYRLMQCLININDLGSNKKLKTPIAIVFSKADRYPNLPPSHQFGKTVFAELYPLLERRVKHFHFFKVAAVISETIDGKPRLPLSPRGIGEVVEWVLAHATAPPGGGRSLEDEKEEISIDDFGVADEGNEMECPACGAIVTSDMPFCPECSEDLSKKTYGGPILGQPGQELKLKTEHEELERERASVRKSSTPPAKSYTKPAVRKGT